MPRRRMMMDGVMVMDVALLITMNMIKIMTIIKKLRINKLNINNITITVHMRFEKLTVKATCQHHKNCGKI